MMVVFFSYKPIVKVRHWLYENATSNDVLYVIEDNPYDRGIDFSFYEVDNQPHVVVIESPAEIVPNLNGDNYLYITNREVYQEYEVLEGSVGVFQSMPMIFTSLLNINNWTGRTTIARFYRIEK